MAALAGAAEAKRDPRISARAALGSQAVEVRGQQPFELLDLGGPAVADLDRKSVV
jgi:hypothetical protein